MHGTRRHGHRGSGYRREASAGPVYWGWSPDSGQMEMMDLRRYVDSIRAGYDRALEDLYGRMSAMSETFGGAIPVMGPAPFTMPLAGPGPAGGRRGRRHGHGHEHGHGGHGCCGDDEEHGHGHRKHDHGGCGDDDDCRCECCIVDADIVVYARCGEVRVIPIEIENETRKDREDVELEVSEFRSGGGRELPWKAALSQKGPLAIRGCDSVKLELLVGVVCGRESTVVGREVDQPKETPREMKEKKAAVGAEEAPATQLVRMATNVRDRTGGVDSCTVGYVTVRVGGCLVRPIVVAVAVLPDDCGAYTATCSCGDCC